MAQRIISNDRYEEVVVRTAPNERLPVDIQGATLSLNADGVEIKNDVGSPIPTAPNITRGGGTIDANTQRVTLASDGPTVTALTNIDGKTAALVSGRVPIDGSGVTQPVSGTILAVGAQAVVSASFTRPANTTAYAANGAVSDSTTAPTILTFASSARVSGGSGLILSARHVKNSTTTANATFRLWLYRATVSAVNDGSQFAMLFANRNNRIGYIDFSHTTAGIGSDASSSLVTFVNLPFVATGTSLFGQLIATAAYVPTSGEQHYLELQIAQN